MTQKTKPSWKRSAALWSMAAIALVIAVGTLVPTPNLGSVPGGDKTHHLLGFAALTLPAAIYKPERLKIVLPLALLYGAMIEIIQPYVGRSGEFADFLADAVGACLGAAIGLLIHRFMRAPKLTNARR